MDGHFQGFHALLAINDFFYNFPEKSIPFKLRNFCTTDVRFLTAKCKQGIILLFNSGRSSAPLQFKILSIFHKAAEKIPIYSILHKLPNFKFHCVRLGSHSHALKKYKTSKLQNVN